MKPEPTQRRVARCSGLALLLAALVVLLWITMPISASGGVGSLLTFYATPACQVVVGTALVGCGNPPPSYPTPYFTVQMVQCDCGGTGGGAGSGDGDENFEPVFGP